MNSFDLAGVASGFGAALDSSILLIRWHARRIRTRLAQHPPSNLVGMTEATTTHWVLTLVCEDKPGIVHAISGAIFAANGNITESHQYSSPDTGRFFMRL